MKIPKLQVIPRKQTKKELNKVKLVNKLIKFHFGGKKEQKLARFWIEWQKQYYKKNPLNLIEVKWEKQTD